MQPLVSIIIRAKNEERWIAGCLRSVFTQDYENFEVILVDNKSTDLTLHKAREFDVKIVKIEDYTPGLAINIGIRASKGEIISCLSAHCIPVDNSWLSNLVRGLDDQAIAGIYGRQEPLSFSSDFDKRDLITVFGLDNKIQEKDPFFHNANSAFRRQVWEQTPFDETLTNIEDRLWGQLVLNKGYKLAYEPAASVYHYHGIHHNLSPDRARHVVTIMESIDGGGSPNGFIQPEEMNILALLPVKGPVRKFGGRPLLEYSLDSVKCSELITDFIVAADNQEHLKIATDAGFSKSFLRPTSLSEEFVDVMDVFRYALQRVEEAGDIPDLIVLLEETYPFRSDYLIDDMIRRMIAEGLDSIVTVKLEPRQIWMKQGDQITDIGDGLTPRHLKRHQAYISLVGLVMVTLPALVRRGERFGDRMGIYEIKEPLASNEIRDDSSVMMATSLVGEMKKT